MKSALNKNPMRSVTVDAPSRLHFGLYSFGQGVPQYGGLGMMLDRPRILLRIQPAPSMTIAGLYPERVRHFAETWYQATGQTARDVTLDLVEAPPQHQGMGLGTALGMAVAAGLRAFHHMPPTDAATLAKSVERGRRSAVGAHGFIHGGFIAEAGREPGDESLSALEIRLSVPPAWRFVLAQLPTEDAGISGAAESAAFADLPAVPSTTRARLVQIAHDRVAPAIERADFSNFSRALFEFGHLAGECFSPIQGGPYRGPAVTKLVEWIRRAGFHGVGQSSWGPTVYVAAPNDDQAHDLVDRLKAWSPKLQITVAAVRNSGATIEPSTDDAAELG